MDKQQYNIRSFQVISVLMLIYFFYNWSSKPLYKSLLLWSSLVIATPIPNAAILLSFPLKVFFNIEMYISQIGASVLSVFLIAFLPPADRPGFLKTIIRQKLYYVFVLCIISSVVLAGVIDKIIEHPINELR